MVTPHSPTDSPEQRDRQEPVSGGLPSLEYHVITVVHERFCSGFKEQIYDVYRYLPPATQVVLISATLPHEILEMTNKFMTDPIRILVKR